MKPTKASRYVVAALLLTFCMSAFALAADLININTASQADLITLKGIGPVKAQAIISYREEHPFYSIEDIQQVKGIGDATFAGIKDFITVGDVVAPPKAPVPAPAPTKTAVSKSTSALKIPTGSSGISQTAAAVESNTLPQPPALLIGDTFWTSLLGLAALIVIGVGGALYVRGSKTALSTQETIPTAEEFEIE